MAYSDAGIEALSAAEIHDKAEKLLARFTETGATGGAQGQAMFFARCCKSLARRVLRGEKDGEALRSALRIYQESQR